MIGVFKKERKNSTRDVKRQAKMEEPVISQQLGMDLQLVVILINMATTIFLIGAYNYFLLQ